MTSTPTAEVCVCASRLEQGRVHEPPAYPSPEDTPGTTKSDCNDTLIVLDVGQESPGDCAELYARNPLEHARTIRLLDLEADSAFEKPLRATMCTTTLFNTNESDVEPQCPLIYQALSYAWGTNIVSDSIVVDGFTFEITLSLSLALRRIRQKMEPEGPFYSKLWVDAICINQNDTAERGHQVAVMGDIFEQASTLIIWLGDAPESDCASLAQGWSISRRRTLKQMLRSEYFGRRWIIQEVLRALPASRYVLFGSYVESLDIFVALANFHCARQVRIDAPVLSQVICMGNHLDPMGWQRSSRQSLLRNLILYRRTECRDPLDRVYALIGISAIPDWLTVDYNKSFVDLYVQLAAFAMSLGRPYDLQQILVFATITNSEKLPSWAPNWACVTPEICSEHSEIIDYWDGQTENNHSYRGTALISTRVDRHISTFELAGWLLDYTDYFQFCEAFVAEYSRSCKTTRRLPDLPHNSQLLLISCGTEFLPTVYVVQPGRVGCYRLLWCFSLVELPDITPVVTHKSGLYDVDRDRPYLRMSLVNDITPWLWVCLE